MKPAAAIGAAGHSLGGRASRRLDAQYPAIEI